MSNKFIGFLESAGRLFQKGLAFAVKEAPAVDALAALIYPPSVAVTGPATIALNLLQNSVLSIEQKYAASGVQNGTGAQKAAEVIALSGPAAVQLLTSAGLKDVDSVYVQNLITLLVGILNIKPPVAAA
jgi:hypothetical protein